MLKLWELKDLDHNSPIAYQGWTSVVSDLADQMQIGPGFTEGDYKTYFGGCMVIKGWALKI